MIEKVHYLGFNMKFRLERHADFSSFYQVFVEDSYPHLLNYIRKGDTVIDAGANIGIFTVISSFITGDNGLIIAVEPDPENKKILEKNISLNQLKNVIIVDKALYNISNTTVDLQSNGTMSHITRESEINSLVNFSRYSVKTITFDDLITDLNISPSILKMDIEGAEKFALKGASKTLKKIKLLEAEIHDMECEQELMKYNEFKFEISNADNINKVLKFAFEHPFKTIKLEYNNNFETAKRMIGRRKSTDIHYPKIIYGTK